MPDAPDNSAALAQLLRASHACVFVPTFEEDYALQVVREAAITLSRPAYCWSVVRGVSEALLSGAKAEPQTEHPIAGIARLTQIAEAAGTGAAMPVLIALDLAAHLGDDRTLRVLRECIERIRRIDAALVLIDSRPDLPPAIAAEAARLDLALPGEDELRAIVKSTLQWMNRGSPVTVKVTQREFDTIIRNLKGLTRRQAQQVVIDAAADDRKFDVYALNSILALKRQAVTAGGLLEYVKTPVDLDRIGGMSRLKTWLKQRERALTDEAIAFGIDPPRGVLMLGVQGAGKSLCAKAIATAWQRPLLRMEVGALYDKFVGESERRLREALKQAEAMAPIILWIDEIEKAFASAASQSTDGGLSKRMFGTLLTWMQEHRSAVFLVATANDIEALPPELLRKGRFDEIFFVDLPGGQAREEILRIHLEKRKRDPAKFDLPRLVAASDGYSGAEIEQGIVSALNQAFADKADIDTDRVARALADSPPLSVTMAERVDELRAWSRGRCVPAE